ncbi:MAG: MFS transporter, partial [Candidatus Limnocylindrales bacterium]
MTLRPATAAIPASVVRPAIVYAIVFSATGAWFPYWSVFAQSLGMKLGTIGLLVATAAAVGILAAPFWGSLADQLGDVRPPLLLASLWSAAMASALFVTREPLLVGVEIVLLAVGTAGMIPLIDTRTVEILGADRDRYGRARAWGSVAFVLTALLVGLIVARGGPVGLFIVYAPALLL